MKNNDPNSSDALEIKVWLETVFLIVSIASLLTFLTNLKGPSSISNMSWGLLGLDSFVFLLDLFVLGISWRQYFQMWRKESRAKMYKQGFAAMNELAQRVRQEAQDD